MFTEFIDGILNEHFTLIKVKSINPNKLAVLQSYAKETLNLETEFDTFSHDAVLRLKRPPKLQVLLDTIRELSEKRNEGLSTGDQPKGS